MGYLLVAIIGGLLAFNSAASPQKASHMAEKVLQQRFPGAEVRVNIEGSSGMPVLHGKFKSVRVELSHVVFTGFPMQPSTEPARSIGHADRIDFILRDLTWNDLHVDAADFSFNDASYDWDKLKNGGQIALVNCGASTAHLVVPAASLQGVVTSKLKDIQKPQLSLVGGRVRVTGRKTVLYVPVSFTYTAKPVPRGNEIWLVEPSLKVGPESLVPLPAERVVGNVNPIFVFDREGQWPFRVQITGVEARDNLLDLTANLQFVQSAPMTPPVEQP